MATNTTTFSVTGTGPNNAPIGGTFSVTGDEVLNFAVLAPIATSPGTLYNLPTITKADVNGLIIVADQNCTINNLSSASTLALTMLAGVPVVWWTGMNYSNPLPTTLATLYIIATVATNVQASFNQTG